jgi:hypothetical protein
MERTKQITTVFDNCFANEIRASSRGEEVDQEAEEKLIKKRRRV